MLDTSLKSTNGLAINNISIFGQSFLLFEGIDAFSESLLIWHYLNIVCVGRNNAVFGVGCGHSEDLWLWCIWQINIVQNCWLVIADLLSSDNILIAVSAFYTNIQCGGVRCFDFLSIQNLLDFFERKTLNIWCYDDCNILFLNFFGCQLYWVNGFGSWNDFSLRNCLNISNNWLIRSWLHIHYNLCFLGFLLALE